MSTRILVKRTGNVVTINGTRATYIHSSCRDCYATAKHIIKMDSPSKHEGCTGNEYKMWLRIRKNILYARYFAPILQHGKLNGYEYNIMPFIMFKRGKRSHSAWLELLPAIEYFDIVDIREYGSVRDYSEPSNWGITVDNHPIIFDYSL